MTHSNAHTQALLAATKQAQRTLDQACTFAELHATAKPLFQRLMRRPGAAPVLVRIVWPGVLQVFDPQTGDVLAESVPGQPEWLKGSRGI